MGNKNQSNAKKQSVKIKTSEIKQKTSLFPKIYRFITEKWKLLISVTVSMLILTAIVLQSISLHRVIQENQAVKAKRGSVEKELAFWKGQLNQYKDARDIYFQIAVLEYELGNDDGARENLKKVLEIDPNFKQGREMEKVIGI